MKKQLSILLVALIAVPLVAGSYIYFGETTQEQGQPPSTTTIDYTVEPSVENLDTSGATPAKTASLVENANQFAFDIYSELAKGGKNTFLSPYSIHTCLGMVYEGARGETAAEMKDALNLPVEDDLRRPAFASLQKQLNTDREVVLKTANALWPQENYPFREDYLNTIRKYYLANVSPLDYIENADGAVEKINSWAAEHTENKIKKVLQRLDPSTRLVLTNAIYFKGDWLIPFDKSKTENEAFHLSDGSTVKTPMMQFHENVLRENEFRYSETEELKALKLPYTGKKMSMTFLLPKDKSKGVDWLKNNVDQNTLKTIEENFKKTKMNKIKIPKFEFKVKYKENFKKALQNLGMKKAFIPGVANFSGMDGTKNLFISKTVHKAYVKVDETGTEAAAVTAVVLRLTSVPSTKPTFVANHPFMFLIKDEKTDSILFMGSVANPQK